MLTILTKITGLIATILIIIIFITFVIFLYSALIFWTAIALVAGVAFLLLKLLKR